MRIKRIKATNLRMFPEVDVPIQDGLTIIRGDNDAGKSTLLTVGPRWCIWGPGAINAQDSLVAYGERNMEVTVEVVINDNNLYRITRRFTKNAWMRTFLLWKALGSASKSP